MPPQNSSRSLSSLVGLCSSLRLACRPESACPQCNWTPVTPTVKTDYNWAGAPLLSLSPRARAPPAHRRLRPARAPLPSLRHRRHVDGSRIDGRMRVRASNPTRRASKRRNPTLPLRRPPARLPASARRPADARAPQGTAPTARSASSRTERRAPGYPCAMGPGPRPRASYISLNPPAYLSSAVGVLLRARAPGSRGGAGFEGGGDRRIAVAMISTSVCRGANSVSHEVLSVRSGPSPGRPRAPRDSAGGPEPDEAPPPPPLSGA